jgi:hypothetical protein
MAVIGDTILGLEVVQFINKLGDDIVDSLESMEPEDFEEGEWYVAYPVMDKYLASEDWNFAWAKYPEWYRVVYMLTDNGQYEDEDVAEMTMLDAFDAFHDEEFDPQVVYWTMND